MSTQFEINNIIADSGNFLTALQLNGTGVSISGHTHIISDVSGLQNSLDSKQPSGSYASLSHSHIISDVSGLQTALDSKQPSGSYAASSHTHTSSNITDFNSSFSGLLPVKDITAGYDISITNTSGSYSIASTNLVHIDGKQPHGFVNRTDSTISISGNVFTIAPTGASYAIYNNGLKVIKTSGESITLPNLTQTNYIHFNVDTTALDNKTTAFDFTTDLPVAYITWNSGVLPSGESVFFAEERHGINMDARTQQWIHNTFGAQYINGLSISNYNTSGNGSSNSHATFSISDGTLYQEDIQIDITNGTSTLPFYQELSPIAKLPVYYHSGTTGQWIKTPATNYPVATGVNGPKYNLLTGNSWSVADVSSGGQTKYFAVWVLATNQIDEPVISILGQRIDSNPGTAESNNSWSDVNLTNLPLNEVQVLYRLIYAGDSDFTNAPKCYLYSILDLRTTIIINTVGTTQNDHGSLFGLADDDHSQYVHIDTARTISANHTFSNGLTSNGLISSSSGNFTSSLQVNGTGVSISGHTHTSSNISNFNSSVSGLVSGFYAPLSGATFTGAISAISGNFTSGIYVVNSGGGIFSMPNNTNNIYFNNTTGNVWFIGDQGGGNNVLAKYINTTSGPVIQFRKYRGSYSSPSGTLSGDNLGSIQYEAVNSDGSFPACVRIQAWTDSSLPSGQANVATQLRFYVASNTDNANNPSQRMVITSSGIAINQSTPSSALDVFGLITSNSGNFTNSLQVNGTGVSISGHTHTASAISDSTAAGRALLTGTDAVAQRTSLGLGTIATEPSGNYALSSHTHTSSSITNFNSSVSGLLSVTNIIAGTNITVTSSSGVFTINSTGGSSSIDGGQYPLITISSQPSGTSVAVSGTATFSVTAAATSPSGSISYQWQESSNNSTWSNISGSTSSTLTLSNVQSGKNGYYYRCNLQSLLSNINSSSAQLTVAASFTATAVMLTSGTTYTVPAGATNMKAYSIGSGAGVGGAGGVAYKTWAVSSGASVTYAAASAPASEGANGTASTVTFSGVTITGSGGASYGSGGGYSGGDGGVTGGVGSFGNDTSYGGAVGGNSQTLVSCGRRPAADVSGLLAAVALAGGTISETCAATAAFGSGAAKGKFSAAVSAGTGGGGASNYGWVPGGRGAVVLYFT